MNRGQSLFEVVVALGISALVVGAIVSLATNSIRNAAFSKNQSLAANYAQQATEWLRGQRDADIVSFSAKAGQSGVATSYCLPDLSNLSSLSPGGTPPNCTDPIAGTPFTRWVTFTPTVQSLPPPSTGVVNLIEADVTVSWTDSQGIHKFTSATSFSDWRQR